MATAPPRPSRAPVALLVVGVVLTVVGWFAFVVAVLVIVGEGEGEEGSSTVQNAGGVVAVLGAVAGSIGPFLITAGAIWWAFAVRARQPHPGTSMRTGADRIIG